jgi:predicted transcriptional regulator
MQVLQQGKPVQEQTAKDILFEILADKYARAILESTIEMPKSVIELSTDCGIPISTAYRRVRLLHNYKLVGISGSINEDGKKYFLYKSKVKSIMTCFNNGSLEAEIVPNSSGLTEN